MKLNFSQLKLKAIDGTVMDVEVHKLLANALYVYVHDLGMLDIARAIYKGEEVELTSTQVKEIDSVLENERAGFAAFIKEAIKNYLKECK